MICSKEPKNIGLVDADLLDHGTRFPNLALMKISSHHKAKENSADLLDCYLSTDAYDNVYISKVFSSTKIPSWIESHPNVEIGGTGTSSNRKLPHDVEHCMPDYSLYDNMIKSKKIKLQKSSMYLYINSSIGFTTRGCFRKCQFCVNRDSDKSVLHSPVEEFLDDRRKYIILCDDNVFACRDWEGVFQQLNQTGKPFTFKQGLDIRLLDKKKASVLADSNYLNEYIFAFDNIEDSEIIISKLKLLRDHTDRRAKAYVLCAYHYDGLEDIESIFKRISILAEYKCLPYLMRYDSYKNSAIEPIYTALARWINQPRIFKTMTFTEFCNREKEIGKKFPDVVKDFEEQNPRISRYFNINYWSD